jgi:hypothetical protein
MKTFTFSLCTLILCITTEATGQELLVGGNLEDSTAWKVSNLDSQIFSEFTFNYTDDGPSYGQGGCLRVTSTGAANQWTNIVFYQTVTLTGGAQYELTGAFKDLNGTISEFWCDVRWDTTAPPTSTDFGGTLIVGFNTWDGTIPGVDGTFQDDGSARDNVFAAPGASGQPIAVYIAVGVGSGAWANPSYSFDVVVDELSLKPAGSTSVQPGKHSIVDQFKLYQNYPNPFNPQTTISYSLAQAGTVTLKVYDLMGRETATLAHNVEETAGSHEVSFDAAELPSGVYFCRLQTERFVETKRMMLIK